MRLIDADFMKKSIRLTQYANKADKAMVEDIKQWIDNQPTVEPLKEQETIEPLVEGNAGTFEIASSWWYACGKCHEQLDINDNYCRHCGKAVKWE